MLPIFNKLVGQRVYQQASYRNIPFSFPNTHHPTKQNQVLVTPVVPRPDCFNFWFWVGGTPTATIICIRIGEAIIFINKCRHNLVSQTIIEWNQNYLTVTTNLGGSIGSFYGALYFLEQCRLAVS